MAIKKTGKRLRVKNTAKIPKTLGGSLSGKYNDIKNIKYSNNSLDSRSGQGIIGGTGSGSITHATPNTTQLDRDKNLNSPLGEWLRKNALTTTANPINGGGVTTSIAINQSTSSSPIRGKILFEEQLFYIYDRYTFRSELFQCTADVDARDTTINIVSTTLIKNKHRFASGSYIISDFKRLQIEALNSEFRVNIKKGRDNFLTRLSTANQWGNTGGYYVFNGTGTNPSFSFNSAFRSAFITISNVFLKSIDIAYYTNVSCDLEFKVGLIVWRNGFTTTPTYADLPMVTGTDPSGTHTANTQYTKTIELTGLAGIDTQLGVGLFVRSDTSNTFIYGYGSASFKNIPS